MCVWCPAMKITAVLDKRVGSQGNTEYEVRYRPKTEGTSPVVAWVDAAKVSGEPLRRFEDLRAAEALFADTSASRLGSAPKVKTAPEKKRKSPDVAGGGARTELTPNRRPVKKGRGDTADTAIVVGDAAPLSSSKLPVVQVTPEDDHRAQPKTVTTGRRPVTSAVSALAPPPTEGQRTTAPLSSPRSFKGIIRKAASEKRDTGSTGSLFGTTAASPRLAVGAGRSPGASAHRPPPRPLLREDSADFFVVQRRDSAAPSKGVLTSHQREVRKEQKDKTSVAERALLDHGASTMGIGGDSQSMFGDRTQQSDTGGADDSNTNAHVPARFRLNRSSDEITPAAPVALSFSPRP